MEVFERVTETKIPLKYVDRRLGDITAMWADATLAREELGWSTKLTIEEMCKYTYFRRRQDFVNTIGEICILS